MKHFFNQMIMYHEIHKQDRYDKKSIIITSHLPVVKWYEFIGEPTLADAIMNRLAVNAHQIELKGESLRKKKSEKKE